MAWAFWSAARGKLWYKVRLLQEGTHPLHAVRFFHHHGGAVFLVVGRQRAARGRDRDTCNARFASMADADAEALFHRLVRRAGAVRWRVRRRDAQGPGDV